LKDTRINTAEHFPNAGIPTCNALHSFFEENLTLFLLHLKVSVNLESQKGKLASCNWKTCGEMIHTYFLF